MPRVCRVFEMSTVLLVVSVSMFKIGVAKIII